ncbi:MAG: hypothetical protein D6794_04490 [Deltaproteobacteria bacterium]|nr:MAG: hypothetical protein D6794_04490 [Deltaproteobacteria bacterium]
MSETVLVSLSREELDLVQFFRQLPEEQRLLLLEEAETMVASQDRMRILASRGAGRDWFAPDTASC